MGAKDQGTDTRTTQNRWQVIPRTLSFVTFKDEILLLKRAETRRIFPGYYNGVGGHIERNEDPMQGAIREIQEETALPVKNVRYCGSTQIDTGQPAGIILFIFTAEALHKDFRDSTEGKLAWISRVTVLEKIKQPDANFPLVEDLPHILPRIFSNERPFFAHVSYDADDRIQINFMESD